MARNELYWQFLDDGETFELEIQRGNKKSLRHKGFAPKNVRVRSPVPTAARLIDNSTFFARKGFSGGTFESVLEHYIQCRHREIAEQVREIEKCIKRIERLNECVEIARKVHAGELWQT